MQLRSNEEERRIIASIIKNAPSYWSNEKLERFVQEFRKLYKEFINER